MPQRDRNFGLIVCEQQDTAAPHDCSLFAVLTTTWFTGPQHALGVVNNRPPTQKMDMIFCLGRLYLPLMCSTRDGKSK